MSQDLSRRGLFSALAPGRADAASTPMVARIAEGCLDAQGVGCRRCPEVCDADAIEFRLIGRGRARPVVAGARCVGCGACVQVCPVAVLHLVPRERGALVAGLADLARAGASP